MPLISDTLTCDGYNGLLKSPPIKGLNCWAHIRRKFVEALPKGEEKGVSGFVVQQIRALYQIEGALKHGQVDALEIKGIRQKHSRPILESLKKYLDEKARTSLPQDALGKAIAYTQERWRYLIAYLEDGRYEIDNNRLERAIRAICLRSQQLAIRQ